MVYSIVKERRAGWWLLHLFLPVAILAAYQWITQHMYGRGLLLDAAAYAAAKQTSFGKAALPGLLVDLTFTGGCIASIIFFIRQLWSRGVIALGVLCAVLVTVAVVSARHLGAFLLPTDPLAHALVAVQIGVWSTAGVGLVSLAWLDLHGRRDADSLFLLLWLIGTFVFAGFVNWTMNGRSVLPMIVPAGVLIARRLERGGPISRPRRVPATVAPLVAALVVSLAVVWADCRLANTARTAAARIQAQYAPTHGAAWFQGHWGFQYYMQQYGGRAVDVQQSELVRGDIVAVPISNTNIYPMPADRTSLRETFDVRPAGWLATMASSVDAGFYAADAVGPLPFAVGWVAPERFTIYHVNETLRSIASNAETHNNRGVDLAKHGKPVEASAEFSEALRLKPDYAEAHNNLGNILSDQGKNDEAMVQYREALRLNPEYVNAHNNLGITLADLGRTAEARREFLEVLRIDPQNAQARQMLASLAGRGK
jgi:tetratricopeptide (TPR) repeat protein